MTVSGAELGRIDKSNVFVCSALKNNKNSTCNYMPTVYHTLYTYFLLRFEWEMSSGNLLDRMKPSKIGLYGKETWGLQASSTSFNSSWSMETNKVCLKSPGPQAEELQLSSAWKASSKTCLPLLVWSSTPDTRATTLPQQPSAQAFLLPFLTMPIPIWN